MVHDLNHLTSQIPQTGEIEGSFLVLGVPKVMRRSLGLPLLIRSKSALIYFWISNRVAPKDVCEIQNSLLPCLGSWVYRWGDWGHAGRRRLVQVSFDRCPINLVSWACGRRYQAALINQLLYLPGSAAFSSDLGKISLTPRSTFTFNGKLPGCKRSLACRHEHVCWRCLSRL